MILLLCWSAYLDHIILVDPVIRNAELFIGAPAKEWAFCHLRVELKKTTA